MCLYSEKEHFESFHSGPTINAAFNAYKIIHSNLRSQYNPHVWAPGHAFSVKDYESHDLKKHACTINRSFHAYRDFDFAKNIYKWHDANKESVLIRIVIVNRDVTGATKTEVSASTVKWLGDYFCFKSNRWKRLKIKW